MCQGDLPAARRNSLNSLAVNVSVKSGTYLALSSFASDDWLCPVTTRVPNTWGEGPSRLPGPGTRKKYRHRESLWGRAEW